MRNKKNLKELAEIANDIKITKKLLDRALRYRSYIECHIDLYGNRYVETHEIKPYHDTEIENFVMTYGITKDVKVENNYEEIIISTKDIHIHRVFFNGIWQYDGISFDGMDEYFNVQKIDPKYIVPSLKNIADKSPKYKYVVKRNNNTIFFDSYGYGGNLVYRSESDTNPISFAIVNDNLICLFSNEYNKQNIREVVYEG